MVAPDRPGRWVWPVAAALAVPLLVGTGLSIWALSRSPLDAASTPEPAIAQVESTERDGAITAAVQLSGPATITATTHATGTVTALPVTPGVPLESGATIMAVDGMEVIGYVADAPLYRDLSRGMAGDDVDAAQDLLVDLELLEESTGVVDAATEAAIVAFNENTGRGADDRTLARAALIWVPSNARTPRTIDVAIGSHVAPGTEVFTAVDQGREVVVLTDPVDAERIVTLGDVTAPLPSGESTIAGSELVEAIAALGEETATVPVSITWATPVTVGTVPTTAVVTDASGAVCFFPDLTGAGVPIAATAGSYGLVDVDPELIGSPVLLNPRQTRGDLTCD